MAVFYNFIIAILIMGGLLGWSLFAYTLAQTICSRNIELEMIKEISGELKKVKQDIKELK
jgi:hypothetical protein